MLFVFLSVYVSVLLFLEFCSFIKLIVLRLVVAEFVVLLIWIGVSFEVIVVVLVVFVLVIVVFVVVLVVIVIVLLLVIVIA